MKALVDLVIIIILSFLALFFGGMVVRTISVVYSAEASLQWEYMSAMLGSLTLIVLCSIMFFIFGALATVVIERLKEHFRK